jgi:DNA-binding beta-propeller fold protein YncE
MPHTRLNEPSLALEDRLLFAPDVVGQRQVIVDTSRGEMVGQIAMIDPADGTRMSAPHNTYASSDGRWIFATSIFSKKIAKIDAEKRQIVRVYPLTGQPRPAALLDDLTKIYVQYSQLHGFVELDLTTGMETARISWPEARKSPDPFTKCHGIGISPDQKQLWAASNIDGKVYAYSLPDLQLLGSIEVGEMPNWIAFTPDSRFVYVTNQEDEVSNGYVTVIDSRSLSIVSRIEVGQKPKRIHVVEVRRR